MFFVLSSTDDQFMLQLLPLHAFLFETLQYMSLKAHLTNFFTLMNVFVKDQISHANDSLLLMRSAAEPV